MSFTKYILRLDDACEYRNIEMWNKIEDLCDKYSIKPLIGVIPKCEDVDLIRLGFDENYISAIYRWKSKGYELALHGYNHVFISNCKGINPINDKSEFAGVSLENQIKKISDGLKILNSYGVEPKVFFAPAHTFDNNTLIALKKSNIKIISDTPAFDVYSKYGFTFVPVQSGQPRRLPFKTVTICLHPNNMTNHDFKILETFVSENMFVSFPTNEVKRRMRIIDRFVRFLYFWRRRRMN